MNSTNNKIKEAIERIEPSEKAQERILQRIEDGSNTSSFGQSVNLMGRNIQWLTAILVIGIIVSTAIIYVPNLIDGGSDNPDNAEVSTINIPLTPEEMSQVIKVRMIVHDAFREGHYDVYRFNQGAVNRKTGKITLGFAELSDEILDRINVFLSDLIEGNQELSDMGVTLDWFVIERQERRYSARELERIRELFREDSPINVPTSSNWFDEDKKVIYVELMRSDEETLEIKEELYKALASWLSSHDELSKMGVTVDLFVINGAGPMVTKPVEDDYSGVAKAPQPRAVTLEEATQYFELLWKEYGELQYLGEETITEISVISDEDTGNNNTPISYSTVTLPEPVTLYVFKSNDLRGGISKTCGTVYGGFGGMWGKSGTRVVSHDKSKEAPEIVVSSVSSTGLTYSWLNQTDNQFVYGTPYEIYVKDVIDSKTVWRLLNQGGDWHGIGYWISPLTLTGEEEVNWEWVCGELPAGEYRFEKSIRPDVRTNKRNDIVYVYEFTLP
jgi:hypothetical protein